MGDKNYSLNESLKLVEQLLVNKFLQKLLTNKMWFFENCNLPQNYMTEGIAAAWDGEPGQLLIRYHNSV